MDDDRWESYEFPIHSKHYKANAVYESSFRRDFGKMEPDQQEAVRDSIIKLLRGGRRWTLLQRHKKITTSQIKNISVPKGCTESRAAQDIRYFWSYDKSARIVTFYHVANKQDLQ
jgi:hypothetical protein